MSRLPTILVAVLVVSLQAFVVSLQAEIHQVTLKQAVDLALRQNPDLALARLDERKAEEDVRIARDPFTPRIAVGSGLAYNNGFPLSIEGSAPTIFRAQASQYLFNRQQTWTVARAKENARGAGLGVASKQDEIAYRVATLFLDAHRAGRESALARKQVESLDKVAATVRTRVAEGRELELENKRSAFNLARARQRVELIEASRIEAETTLAVVLGFDNEDQVRPVEDARADLPLPESEDSAVESALKSSKELRRIESQLMAEGLDIRAQRAARLPRVDFHAQYGIFSRFNNYDDFYATFQRHNGMIGLSFQIPVLVGPAVSALSAQAEINAARLRVELNSARQRTSLDARKSYREVERSRTTAEVARLDLDLAREQLSVLLAQMAEGRTSFTQVEEARFVENEKWIAFYNAQHALERARLQLLYQTGGLIASLR